MLFFPLDSLDFFFLNGHYSTFCKLANKNLFWNQAPGLVFVWWCAFAVVPLADISANECAEAWEMSNQAFAIIGGGSLSPLGLDMGTRGLLVQDQLGSLDVWSVDW